MCFAQVHGMYVLQHTHPAVSTSQSISQVASKPFVCFLDRVLCALAGWMRMSTFDTVLVCSRRWLPIQLTAISLFSPTSATLSGTCSLLQVLDHGRRRDPLVGHTDVFVLTQRCLCFAFFVCCCCCCCCRCWCRSQHRAYLDSRIIKHLSQLKAHL